MFDKIDSMESIIEIELPTGIKIPECTVCHNKSDFMLEVETDHEIDVNPLGFMNINQPKISRDVVNKHLKPENISCAHCIHQSEKEK
jgi:hypothetical protein